MGLYESIQYCLQTNRQGQSQAIALAIKADKIDVYCVLSTYNYFGYVHEHSKVMI
jgi:hypothetical protein